MRPSEIDKLSRDSGGFVVWDRESETLYVPIIDCPGRGSAFLDSLPRDVKVTVPMVLNPKLAGMLRRRGFHLSWEYFPETDVWADTFVRYPERQQTKVLA